MASPGSELLVFSTELKGILAHPAVPPQVCRGLVAKGPKVELQAHRALEAALRVCPNKPKKQAVERSSLADILLRLAAEL